MNAEPPKQKHLVFVTQVFYPDPQSTSELLTLLLSDVAKNCRVRITVISGFPSSFGGTSQNIPRREQHGGIEIYRCGLFIDAKRNLFCRFLNFLSFLIHASWVLLWLRQKDLIVGVTNPPFLCIALWATSFIGRFRYQYLLHDVYPEGLVAMKLLSSRSPISWLWKRLNRASYRRADKLIVIGRDMARLLNENYGIDPGKIVIIPNWSIFDQENPQSFAESALAKDLGLVGKFVVQYSGNMGLWHDLDIFVRAAEIMQSKEPGIRFLFIGNGMRLQAAKELSRQLKLENVTWLDFFPKERLHESLGCCHVTLISLRASLQGIAVPCKLYSILASGRAIIAQVPVTSEVAEVIREEKCGICVQPGDCKALVEAIDQLHRDRALLQYMSDAAFSAYQKKYRFTDAVNAYVKLWELENEKKMAG